MTIMIDHLTHRLCDCFASQSIVVEELNDQTARAVVRSTKGVDTVKIAVQLYYADTTTTTKEKKGRAVRSIIVEVVRLSGDMLLFRRESRAILQAAKNTNTNTALTASLLSSSSAAAADEKAVVSPKKKNSTAAAINNIKRSLLRRSHKPESLLLSNKKKRSRSTVLLVGNNNDNDDEQDDEHMHMAIEKIDELMKKDRMDACIIGWVSLCALTDSSSTGASASCSSTSTSSSVYASKIVLGIPAMLLHDSSIDDDMEMGGATTDIHRIVFDVLSTRCDEHTDNNTNTGGGIMEDDQTTTTTTATSLIAIEKELTLRIRRLAFQVLKNALHTLFNHTTFLQTAMCMRSNDTDIDVDVDTDCYRMMIDDLIALLIEEIRVGITMKKNTNNTLCEASLAAACLNVLLEIICSTTTSRSSSVRRKARKMGAQDVLIQAKYAGGCSYKELAVASEGALAALMLLETTV